jgi:putative endonuclease
LELDAMVELERWAHRKNFSPCRLFPFGLSFRSEVKESAFCAAITILAMPRREFHFYVYILSSKSRTLYIGVTNHLRGRVLEHREKTPGSFTARYNIDRLVYFERFQYVGNAIAREKELKDWNRARKIALIEAENPLWDALAADW